MAPANAGLIVYVAALDRDPRTAYAPLISELEKEAALRDYQHFVYPTGIKRTSGGSLTTRARDLCLTIQEAWDRCGRPDHVVLVGHSIGGLLVRRAYIDAFGDADTAREPWFDRVQRIVLFAAPNRGIMLRKVPWFGWLLAAGASLPGVLRRFAAGGAVTGSPFITDLRIGWVTHVNTLEHPPVVVQVRGTADKVVAPTDSRDLESMPNSAFIELPEANHGRVIEPHPKHEPVPGAQRDTIVRAVCGDVSEDVAPTRQGDDQIDPTKDAVAFLLHGIRADAHGWVEKIGSQLSGAGVAIENKSYGYLPAFSFAMPFGHRRNLRKFADWYTEQRAKYPRATCHFVGHSNGTYIFAKSLQRIPYMSFERVYLAGSVLSPTYDWDQHLNRGQIKMVVNACGSRDGPVGILCSALHGLGRLTLGVGGFRGFLTLTAPNVQFVNILGGHDAGLTVPRLPGVATYICSGVPPTVADNAPAPWTRVSAGAVFRTLSRACGVVVPILALAGIAALVCFFTPALLLIVLAVLFVVAVILSFF